MANTALITGSYGGLGTCFADIHAGKGGDLVLVGRSQEKLDHCGKSIAHGRPGVRLYKSTRRDMLLNLS